MKTQTQPKLQISRAAPARRNHRLLLTQLSLICVLLAILCVGCGKKAVVLGPVKPNAFDSAPEEIKQLWERSIAEAGSNQFAAAITTVQGMSREAHASLEQWQAMHDACLVYEDQLRKLANSGDEAARADMQKLGINPNPPTK
jgi:hypothetical protein